ncbi:TnsD family Tn7-like transposition protein [Heyndrickxia vini]|uniref:TniQ family protein n=1 Tax=Heyndrickxia vini TaxID=1476025 RepID=A0ABX7E218_9BACI|nr:TnsD family Tn7-like transposition protein [Heyndrickxia vini]QQZ09621.1 TniQ family protein [Heyndrickxia vini]
MITYFPTPYNDESLYSIVARYHIHNGHKWPGATLEELFNSNKIRKVEEVYIRYLPSLVKKISVFSNKFTSKYFIDNHTEIPIVRPFKENSWYNDFTLNLDRNARRGSKVLYSSYLPKQYSSNAQNISSKEYFYYCPECLMNQYNEFGECFWNRLHQIPGIFVCNIHKIPLLEHYMNFKNFKKVNFITPKLEDAYRKGHKFKENIMDLLINISEDLEYLMRRNFSSLSEQYLFEKYMVLMKIKGIGFPFNKRQRLLGEMVLDFYPEEILNLFNSNFDLLDKRNWLETITTQSRMVYCHPLRHVLVMRVLSGSVKNFFEKEYIYEPFGQKPWICMNPLSEHYLKPKVNRLDLSVNENTRNIQGDFVCDCGYVYRLREGEIDPTQVKNFNNRVIKRGALWEKSLLKLVEDKMMKKDIADITMLNRNALAKIINQLINMRQLDEQNQHVEHKKKKTLEYREEWIKLRKSHPSLPRKELSSINRKVYVWLNKHDKDWLIKNSPARRNTVSKKLNYAERDLFLLKKAKQINQKWSRLEEANNRIIRKSLNQMYELLGNNLYRKTEQYPLTVEYLQSIQESLVEFQKRRIIYVLNNRYCNSTVSFTQVKFHVGLSKNSNETLTNYLLKMIKHHNEKFKPPSN